MKFALRLRNQKVACAYPVHSGTAEGLFRTRLRYSVFPLNTTCFTSTPQSRGLLDGLCGAGRRDGRFGASSDTLQPVHIFGLLCEVLCVVSDTMSGTMSWDVRDAIVLIDQLLETLGPVYIIPS